MTWLFVPETSSACAPASADWNSASSLPSTTLERLDGAWFTWRGKPQPPQAWSRRWKQGGFIRLLSGLTCEPSTLDRGVASFISSLLETLARKIQSQESELVPQEPGSSRPKCVGSLPSAGLILSSERTSRGTPTDNLKPSSRHWKDWATALRQEYSARPRLATPCGASDCSSWPSAKLDWAAPQARDHFPAHTPEYVAAKKAEGHGMRNLNDEAAKWMAPVADDTGTRTKRYEQGGIPLPAQAVTAAETYESQTWPAPASRDHKGSSPTSLIRQDGKVRSDMLDYAAEQFFNPPSSPDQPIAGGSMSSTDSPNSNHPSVRRKLNPIFVEALMRWPTGLSGFERQEMAWTRWWHVQRSYLSALYSGYGDEPAQASLF